MHLVAIFILINTILLGILLVLVGFASTIRQIVDKNLAAFSRIVTFHNPIFRSLHTAQTFSAFNYDAMHKDAYATKTKPSTQGPI